jgi:hypothetical protein
MAAHKTRRILFLEEKGAFAEITGLTVSARPSRSACLSPSEKNTSYRPEAAE